MININVTDKEAVLSLDTENVAHASLTAQEIISNLKQLGVSHCILEDAIIDVISQFEAYKKGEDDSLTKIENVIVAHQIEPAAGAFAPLNFHLRNAQIVAPGDLIAEMGEVVGAHDGVTLAGEVIPAPEAERPEPSSGAHTEVVDGQQIKSLLFGKLIVKSNEASVEPLVRVSHDKLSAHSDIYPCSDSELPINLEMVKAALNAAGVVHGIDDSAISAAITEAVEKQAVVQQVCAAKGQAAKPMVPATFKYEFLIANTDPSELTAEQRHAAVQKSVLVLDLVNKGDVLCTETPAVESQMGKDVYGEDIVPPPVENTPTPQCGKNVARVKGELKYTAVIQGFADYNKGQLKVRRPISVSADGMEAVLSCHPPRPRRQAFSSKLVEKTIADKKIIFGINWKRVNKILEMVALDKRPRKKLWIARGQQAVAGVDAYLKFFVDMEGSPGKTREDGTIDFHELGTIHNIKSGSKICQRIPPTMGKPQIDIYGQSTPAEPGKNELFKAGENVELRGEEFYATQDGFIYMTENTVSVSETFSVSGDINLATGNLHQDSGGILISGTIRSGFEVSAGGSILVNQLVESALVKSDENIEIKGGILQNENGRIMAGGSIKAKFAQNATLQAGGDILIGGAAINCKLTSDSKIIISGTKGCLVGGSAKARKGIEVQQLGAKTGDITEVEIDIDRAELNCIDQKIESLQKRMPHETGSEEHRSQGEEPATNEDGNEDLLKQLKILKKERDRLIEAVDLSSSIIVKGQLQPPVVAKLFGVIRTINTDYDACEILLNDRNEIQILPIKR